MTSSHLACWLSWSSTAFRIDMQITIDSTSVLDYRFYLPIPGSWLLKHPFPSLLFYTDEKQSPLSPAIINIAKRICNKINTCL